jgi:hypothetical protein
MTSVIVFILQEAQAFVVMAQEGFGLRLQDQSVLTGFSAANTVVQVCNHPSFMEACLL